MIKKFAANDIADEMFRLLKKKAQASEEDDARTPPVAEDEDEADDAVKLSDEENSADDGSEEDNLEDFLMRENPADDGDDASYVDDEISDMMNHAEDESDLMSRDELPAHTAKDEHLMHGLGKIEASLRRKGEGFAADLVRTTAMSIKQDIVKAASQKTYVLKNLIKMASDLDSRGQKKAAGLVKMTIEKINR